VDLVGTPCYMMSSKIVRSNLGSLADTLSGLPVRHWLSAKTQPIRALFELWRSLGLGIEVVSEFELAAALSVGFAPDEILVNGVAKHTWLRRYARARMRVHFDSILEVQLLGDLSAELEWTTGLRLAMPPSVAGDPDRDGADTQFGMSLEEMEAAVKLLGDRGRTVTGLHFHLGTDIRDSRRFASAVEVAVGSIRQLDLRPEYLDFGGGFPLARHCGESEFSLESIRRTIQFALSAIPSLKEIWMENGRHITGSAAALAVTVTDVKERSDGRYVICDGGRTNHALVSDWESHPLVFPDGRSADVRETIVCGPTCMPFDRLAKLPMPKLQVGDTLVWLEAGAYHIPWETRFSFGTAPVVWVDDNDDVRICRSRESPSDWWAQWLGDGFMEAQ